MWGSKFVSRHPSLKLYMSVKLCVQTDINCSYRRGVCVLNNGNRNSSITSIVFLPLSSAGFSAGPSGSLSQGLSACVCEAGAGPAVAGLQCSWIHDVKAYR